MSTNWSPKTIEKLDHVRIIIACSLLMIVGLYFDGAILNIYSGIIADNLGFSRGVFSVFATFRYFFAFLVNLKLLSIFERFGIKRTVCAGVLLVAAVQLALSFSSSLTSVYLVGILAGVAYSFTTLIPSSIIVKNWFNHSQGVALAIVTSSTGIASIIVSPILSRLVTDHGWRFGFRINALTCVIVFVIELFLMLERPHGEEAAPLQKNQRRSGLAEHGSAEEGKKLHPFTRSADGTNLRLLLLIAILYNIGIICIDGSMAVVLIEKGYAQVFATGAAVSVAGFANMAGKLIMGEVNDRLGTHRMAIAWYGIAIFTTGFFLFYNGTSIPAACIGAASVGFISGIYSIPLPALSARLFRTQNAYNSAVSYLSAATCLCFSMANIIFHGLYDRTGSYHLSLIYAFTLACICFCIVVLVVVRNRKAFGHF
ncbi:MAG: MFS transporter [Lachnospiraceae bacterium]|nr:MFS transporter [Lachnospiraceae bacterium]